MDLEAVHIADMPAGRNEDCGKILQKLSRDRDEEKLMIDGSYVQVHQHGDGGKGGHKSKGLVTLEVDIPPRSMP